MSSERAVVMMWVALIVMVTAAASGQQPRMPSLNERLRQQAVEVGGPDAQVCDVAPLASRAIADLFVASLDTSGRQFCNELVVFRAGVKPQAIDSIETWWMPTVADAVQDLDGDGDSEIVAPRQLSTYEGTAACVATYPVVYQCRSDGCSEVSERFTAFYIERSSKARIQLADKERGIGRNDISDTPCLHMTIDKIDRLLGNDPLAGFDQAKQWMAGSDRYLRRKAADVFADIVTLDALKQLEALTADRDRAVAEHARLRLATRKPRPQ